MADAASRSSAKWTGIMAEARKKLVPMPERRAETAHPLSDCKHTMESSSAVRLIEKKPPVVAQAGTAASASSLQMAKVSGSKVRIRWAAISL